MKRVWAAGLAAGLSLSMGLSMGAVAQEHGHDAGAGVTQSLQGDAGGWFANPQMKAFYAASVEALAGGPDKVDMAAYEARSKEIFIAFAMSMDADPAVMLDHLKLIPRQVVEIAREDPAILRSYESFVLALHGPG